jgi:predicted RNA-binding protein YlqC (UPF0109 family)
MIEKLLEEIVCGLVDNKESIKITKSEPSGDGVEIYHLNVAPDDMGRVIGKQGRIAKAIRTIVRSAANRTGKKILIEID